MKPYPTISRAIDYNERVHIFDKLDGSCIRAEWSKKRGEFYKFGSRNQLIDESFPVLGASIELIKSKYERDLHDVLKRLNAKSAVCFFEFFGPNSFAGNHVEDESKDVVLFDVAPYKKGMMLPSDFVRSFGHLHVPRLIDVSRMTKELSQRVRNSELEGVTFEGVVCKPNNSKKRPFKVKSVRWLYRLKELCQGDDELFEKLM